MECLVRISVDVILWSTGLTEEEDQVRQWAPRQTTDCCILETVTYFDSSVHFKGSISRIGASFCSLIPQSLQLYMHAHTHTVCKSRFLIPVTVETVTLLQGFHNSTHNSPTFFSCSNVFFHDRAFARIFFLFKCKSNCSYFSLMLE